MSMKKLYIVDAHVRVNRTLIFCASSCPYTSVTSTAFHLYGNNPSSESEASNWNAPGSQIFDSESQEILTKRE